MRRFFTDNINSILGTISIHLMVVLIFLWFKLGEAQEMQKKEEVLIEFNEEMKPLEEKAPAESNPSSEAYGEGLPTLDRQTLHSIASSVSSKLDNEISTEKYAQQVMSELGISSLASPGGAMEEQAETEDENAIYSTEQSEASQAEPDVPNIIRKDNTTVSYFLEGRWHKYVYIPTYKCQGGGTIVLDIIINQAGKVISALISENKSSPDPCLREEAYRSAITAQFNGDMQSMPKQLGTMTYVFLPQ